MKKIILIFGFLLPVFLYAQTSIYNIQFTTVSVDGSYPSTKNGQTLTTGGIVTATGYLGGRYYISSSQGGAWNGLFVYSKVNSPTIGDSIQITGTISEYEGYTEIKDLTSFSIASSGNTLPPATIISTSDVTNEAYEGVLVNLIDCNVSTLFDNNGNWWVNDGSGACEIRPGIYNLKNDGFPLIDNYPFKSIKGVIGINYGSISLQPRSIEDIQSADNAFILSTADKIADNKVTFSYPVSVTILNQTESFTSFSLKIQYDKTTFNYDGFDKTGTLSESGTITDVSTTGNIILNYSGSFAVTEKETLVKLSFTPIVTGSANLKSSGTTINGASITYSQMGDLKYTSFDCDIPIGDTLTVVQRPLLNIPSIVVPGQELNLICFAPQSTTSWAAELFYDDIVVPLNVTQSSYDSNLERWTLKTEIPNVDLYELYDLRVTASDGISDDVTNAVKVIDQFKENYYFVHITDLHLLGHTFYGVSGYETDHTEVDDFNEVIKDINLINPEFVLLTGDLVNEGELEDFECLRNHTLTMELLEKLEVPVYIVPGNHDLGGWDATPPPTGTARQEWWRFFGWRQHEIPPTKTVYYSHDYSFDYGNTHFTGLEAYQIDGNYDGYMSDVYGATSFTTDQMTWLNNDLAAAGNKTKVLFYHYDFKHELNLSTLGVDMALWGHTHSDAEDATHPYNISTASVCDGKRIFRVIRVNGSDVKAESSTSTHSNGDMLTVNFNMNNDGSLDSVSAILNNKYAQSFDNGLLKFKMPLCDYGYLTTNGSLEQVLVSGSIATCYVKVNALANSEKVISIKKNIKEASITSIYDIQYTAEVGDGTYPSLLNGQSVTTGGVVTATDYMGERFFISSSQGGSWNGILVYDNNYSPSVGDSIIIKGTVYEYNGYTEIINLTSYDKKNSANILPEATKISTSDVVNEKYEGVLIEVNDSEVSSVYDTDGNWAVNDGSGECEIKIGMYNLKDDDFSLFSNYPFKLIKGVIAYYYGSTSIQPRFNQDLQSGLNAYILSTEDKNVGEKAQIEIPVKIAILNQTEPVSSYTLKMQYDHSTFHFDGFTKASSISESGSVNNVSTEGVVELIFAGSSSFDNFDTLLNLKFTPVANGNASLKFIKTTINGDNMEFYTEGNIKSSGISTYIDNINLFEVNNYPNPFSEKTRLNFSLKESGSVNLSVFNIAGQLVKVLVNDSKSAGSYSIIWDATNSVGKSVEKGVYLYTFSVNGKMISSGQMVFI